MYFGHSLRNIEPTIAMYLQFFLRFHTEFGQSLWISGNTEELGMDVPANAIPMVYLDDEFWQATIQMPQKKWPKKGIIYKEQANACYPQKNACIHDPLMRTNQ